MKRITRAFMIPWEKPCKPMLVFSIILLFPTLMMAQVLPRHMTEQEEAIYPQYLQQQQFRLGAGYTAPPQLPVRTMAEWEEVQAITISWAGYYSILAQIVEAAQSECTVIINCSDSNSVISYLNNVGTSPYNCRFVETSYNSIWIRDYGPHTCYLNDVDSLIFVDWIYNRPRPADDVIPEVLASELGIPLFQTIQSPWALVNTGGNFVPDGNGQAFSSNLVLDENPSLSTAQVDTILEAFMGIKNYVHLTNLPHDNIHHIDMHMKLLDEETLLMGEFPQGVSDGPQIEANLLYSMNNHGSMFGSPFRVVRIPMVPSSGGNYPPTAYYRTFTNGVFVNGTYIFPTYNHAWDTIAFRILGENLPGYKIVGINSEGMIAASGAIHCITKLIGVQDPLLIHHKPLYTVFDTINPYQISALVKHRSGIQSVKLHYRTDTTQAFQAVSMTASGSVPDTWEAGIPPQSGGSRIQYYLDATANSGKNQVRPITAPGGFWTCKVQYFTGLDETIPEPGLPFPNPANSIVAIPITMSKPGTCKIELFDIHGRPAVNIYEGNLPAGESMQFLDASSLRAGTYLIQYTTGQGSAWRRLSVY